MLGACTALVGATSGAPAEPSADNPHRRPSWRWTANAACWRGGLAATGEAFIVQSELARDLRSPS